MWDTLYGKLGLSPAVARGLSWSEVDFYLIGYATRKQEELAGHRMVATRIHNLFPGDGGPLTEAQYHPLPLVDPPTKQAVAADEESLADYAARLAKQNQARLVAATP